MILNSLRVLRHGDIGIVKQRGAVLFILNFKLKFIFSSEKKHFWTAP